MNEVKSISLVAKKAGKRVRVNDKLCIEADSSVPVDEIWALYPDGAIQKIKLQPPRNIVPSPLTKEELEFADD